MSSAPRTRVDLLLVGAGRIARAHGAAIASAPDVGLVGVVDRDVEVARAFAASTVHDDVAVFGSLEHALEVSGATAAIICAPTAVHESIALQVMNAGLHALVEKPLTNDVASALRMSAVARECGVHLMAAQIVRFLPMFEWASEFVQRGELGRPIQFVERRMMYRREHFPWWDDLPHFLVAHWGSHSIDMLCQLTGQVPTSVFCDGSSESDDYDVLDDFDLFLRLDDSTRASFHMSFSCRNPVHDMVLTGEDHTLQFDCYESVAVDGEVAFHLPEAEMLRCGFQRQLEHFRDVVLGRSLATADVSSVIPSLHAIAAAEESLMNAQVVHLPVQTGQPSV